MANIKPYTDKIASAVYGEEVRSSIINALNAASAESAKASTDAASALKTNQDTKGQIDEAKKIVDETKKIVDTKVEGFSPEVTIEKDGGVTTISVTDRTGTKTGTVLDGQTVELSRSDDGLIVTIKNPDGSVASSATVKDGGPGPAGPQPDIVDDLTSTSKTEALSAAQGKALKDLIDDLQSQIDVIKAGSTEVLAEA